ncbi:MAG TPA: hypothetical protein VMF08_10380 [Candidatus Sulfotelmatobacter sp.]|nr:hypothetical protein [Candidatus Sulfotelmatobacter sp.]
MAKKTKTAKATGGITGSAQYMRDLVAKGVLKKAAFEKMLAKWPKFKHDMVGLESRWNTANRLNKSAAAKEKSSTKAPARKASTIPARRAALTLPPRPVAQAA